MDIRELKEGKEYYKSHAHGQPNQKVKVLSVTPIGSEHMEARVLYTSNDCTKGMSTSMNTIECERYLHEIY